MLDQLGLEHVRLTSGGTEANFSCFGSGHAHGDERPSAYMNVDTTAWWCFGCHMKGNAISFVAANKQISNSDAQRWLRDQYGIEFAEPRGGSMMAELDMILAPKKTEIERTRPSPSWLSIARVDWDHELRGREVSRWAAYIGGRGFDAATLEEWGAGYDYQSDRITFPVYDLDDELVGIKARAWRPDHQPKYWIIGDTDPNNLRLGFHPYEASEVVYGLHRQRDVRTVVLCEGEWNAWACAQAGIERPCALGMSYMSARHAQLLAREAEEVVLFGDPDESGDSMARGRVNAAGEREPGAIHLLEPYVSVRVIQGHDDDPAELLRRGRGSEIIELVRAARMSLEISTLFI